MASPKAPEPPRGSDAFVDNSGKLTQYGLLLLNGIWRQVVAGHVIVPCDITGVNVLTLTPSLHSEGAQSYGNGMAFFGKAVAASTGAVTGRVMSATKTLETIKVYKTNGTVQAGAADIALNGYYLFVYHADLNSGAGGLVLK